MMQLVRIQLPDEASRVQGFYELMRMIRVVCLPEDEFVIPEMGLSILDERGIPYALLEESGFDHALETLRDSAATPV